ncbi:MAG: MBL fold metallo-hydrolase, partial [Phycisphaerales bacterium]|nr:MBL fold metallo-hydrolase [Phycisphaerales bacterium]
MPETNPDDANVDACIETRLARHRRGSILLVVILLLLQVGCSAARRTPYFVVLGTGQDAGVPQAGAFDHPGWTNPGLRRAATCLALVDPRTGRQWLFEATPDFRMQHRLLHDITGASRLDGIFLTHAHIGHYTGLMFLGHESMGAKGVPVYAMPRMRSFLETNGPWSQLVRYDNIDLRPVEDGVTLDGPDVMRVEPLVVPHRQEFSEVVGYRIEVEGLRLLFLPDIDSWAEWDDAGTRIE